MCPFVHTTNNLRGVRFKQGPSDLLGHAKIILTHTYTQIRGHGTAEQQHTGLALSPCTQPALQSTDYVQKENMISPTKYRGQTASTKHPKCSLRVMALHSLAPATMTEHCSRIHQRLASLCGGINASFPLPMFYFRVLNIYILWNRKKTVAEFYKQ